MGMDVIALALAIWTRNAARAERRRNTKRAKMSKPRCRTQAETLELEEYERGQEYKFAMLLAPRANRSIRRLNYSTIFCLITIAWFAISYLIFR